AALDLLTREFNLPTSVKARKLANFHPSRGGQVWWGEKLAGVIGELHPDRLSEQKISGRVGYLEIDFDLLRQAAGTTNFKPLSRYPSVTRDLSLIVKDGLTWDDIKAVLDRAGLLGYQYLSEF